MFAPAKMPVSSPGASVNSSRIANISPSETTGMSTPMTMMKCLAARRMPTTNCGPTFMATENMNRLKKIVPTRGS